MDETNKNADAQLPVAPANSLDTAVTITTGVVVALAYLIAAVIPGLNFITFLIAVGGILLLEHLPNSTFSDLSIDIMKLVYPAINQELLLQTLGDAEAKLKGFREKFDSMTQDFKIWETTNDAELKASKAQRLYLLYPSFSTNTVGDIIAAFSNSYLAGTTLFHMVIASTQYLTIMRTYYHHANDLMLPVRTPHVLNRQEQVLAKLQEHMAKLIDMVTQSYKDGLKRLITGASNVPRSWDDYNNYRNTATLTALDLLTHIPYLDPEHYKTGCDVRALNRRLLTLFDTYDDPEWSKQERRQILYIDGIFNLAVPVDNLISIEFNSRSYLDYPKYHDGLSHTRCTKKSTDGYNKVIHDEWTGKPLPSRANFIFQEIDLRPLGCYGLYGQYWNRKDTILTIPTAPLFPDKYYAVTTLINITMLVDFDKNPPQYQKKNFNSLQVTHNSPLSDFEQSLPHDLRKSLPPLPSNFSERLSDFSTMYVKEIQQYSYLLAWHHNTTFNSLLPAINHLPDPGKNSIQQFHAVRAGTYIRKEKLRVIHGPGFTGGDLVEIGAHHNLEFRLINNLKRWFNGHYQARIWYIRPRQDITISVSCIPTGMIHSVTTEDVMGAALTPDPSNLGFSELLQHTLTGTLLITSAMTDIRLRVSNHSSTTSIIIDRVELIHYSFATRDDSPAFVSDHVNPDQADEHHLISTHSWK
jgi:hypothetical protein